MIEEWRKITSWPGYEASSFGRIRNSVTLRVLKPYGDGNGYVRVSRHKSYRKQAHLRVHILVAEAFLGPCPKGKEVNHIDAVRDHNAPINLEYLTRSENFLYAFKVGTKKLRTHCIREHEYTVANTFINARGYRECRICMHDRGVNFRRRLRG